MSSLSGDITRLGIRTQVDLARAMYIGLIDVLKRRVWIHRQLITGRPYVEKAVLHELMTACFIEPNFETGLWELSPLGREIFEHEEDWIDAAARADAQSGTG